MAPFTTGHHFEPYGIAYKFFADHLISHSSIAFLIWYTEPMFPQPPLYISDDLSTGFSRYKQRQHWLMSQCDGPIVIMAPAFGPNQQYPWAHCYQPVYQDSYFLYLTGINQTGIAIVLDPSTSKRHIFLPKYNPSHVLWEGPSFAYGHDESHAVLSQLGFQDVHPMTSFKSRLKQLGSDTSTWHLLLEKDGKKS